MPGIIATLEGLSETAYGRNVGPALGATVLDRETHVVITPAGHVMPSLFVKTGNSRGQSFGARASSSAPTQESASETESEARNRARVRSATARNARGRVADGIRKLSARDLTSPERVALARNVISSAEVAAAADRLARLANERARQWARYRDAVRNRNRAGQAAARDEVGRLLARDQALYGLHRNRLALVQVPVNGLSAVEARSRVDEVERAYARAGF